MGTSKVVDSNIANERRGQFFAFLVFFFGLLGGIWLLAQGLTTSGLVVFLTDVIALAGSFLYGRVRSDRELARKRQELTTEEQKDLFEESG